MSFGQEHVNQAMTTFWNVMTGAGFLLGFTALSFELNPFRFNFQNEEKPGVIIDTTMLYYRKKITS